MNGQHPRVLLPTHWVSQWVQLMGGSHRRLGGERKEKSGLFPSLPHSSHTVFLYQRPPLTAGSRLPPRARAWSRLQEPCAGFPVFHPHHRAQFFSLTFFKHPFGICHLFPATILADTKCKLLCSSTPLDKEPGIVPCYLRSSPHSF